MNEQLHRIMFHSGLGPAIHLFGLSMIIAGCGTTQPFAPAIPLPTGKGEFRVSIGYSTGRFNPLSLQWGAWGFVGGKDALGMTWAGGIFPSAVSYVHYSSDRANLQLHCNDLLGVTFNPAWEFDIGLSQGSWNRFNAAKLGIGFYDTPLLDRLRGMHVKNHAFVPILGYQFRSGEFAAETEVIYGLSTYFVHYYAEQYLTRDADTSEFSGHPFLPRTIQHERVKSIREIPSGHYAPGWYVQLLSNEGIVIASRDPHPDCYECDARQSGLSAYPASPDHRIYWLWQTENERGWYSEMAYPAPMELNMKRILAAFDAGGDLVLREDEDVLKRKLDNVHSGWDDIFFSVARVSQIQNK